VILPLDEGQGELFTTDSVSPKWLWWVAHAGFGITAGIIYDVMRRFLPAPAYPDKLRAEMRPAA
jgi:hypothetical protein